MERTFDMDNFEHSLKQHADQFSMMPSKRVWNGVYNSLHPGSKWPSLTMILIFLLTLVGIGPLNNSSKNLSVPSTPNNSRESAREENESSVLSMNNYGDKAKAFKNENSSARIVPIKNNSGSENKKEETKPVLNPFNHAGISSTRQPNDSKYKTTGKSISSEISDPQTISGDRIQNGIIINFRDYLIKMEQSEAVNLNRIEGEKKISENVYTRQLKDAFPANNLESLASLLQDVPRQSSLVQKKDSGHENETVENNSNSEATAILAKKANSRSTWIFYVTPSITTTYFNGSNHANQQTTAINSGSPLIINPNQVGNSMRFNARIGLNLGTEFNYEFSDGWRFVSGAQISYSGYNILAHKVHPTFSYLLLKENPNTNVMGSKKYITYYGSEEGLDEVFLHNNSIQLSVPVGLNRTVWKNNNVEVSIGSTLQPTLILNGQGYILSTDGRNYVTDPDLMRQINVIGEFNSSITFQGDKVKWHVGPTIRYQALSSYKNIYPVNEHLIDYGIRIGISK